MVDQIDKATSGGDMLTWSIMFGLLIIIVGGLAYWDKKFREEQNR